MQLHPFLSTVSRPVYQDRQHNLFLLVKCPECNGRGEFNYCPINPSEPDYSEQCSCCHGDGEVFEEVSEDEL